MTNEKYINCHDCGSELFTVVPSSKETVKFIWDGGSLITDVQDTEYLDGGYYSADCKNCGKFFNLAELEPDEE